MLRGCFTTSCWLMLTPSKAGRVRVWSLPYLRRFFFHRRLSVEFFRHLRRQTLKEARQMFGFFVSPDCFASIDRWKTSKFIFLPCSAQSIEVLVSFSGPQPSAVEKRQFFHGVCISCSDSGQQWWRYLTYGFRCGSLRSFGGFWCVVSCSSTFLTVSFFPIVAEDGSVKQLDVLANFVPSDFFTTGLLGVSMDSREKCESSSSCW